MPDETKNNVDRSLKIEFTEKKIKAFLIIEEQENTDSVSFTENDINYVIKSTGIKFGVNKNLFNEIQNRKEDERKFLAAQGVEPTPGEDASFIFYFPTEKSLRPTLTEDGHIDYKEVNVVYSVEKDTVLVKKKEARPGKIGMNVLGKELSAPHGKDLNIIPGQGTFKDPEDNLLIKSSMEGVVFYNPKSRQIEIQQLYRIPHSVDYSIGNIHIKSSVEVRGDVDPGFSINTPYNVQIKGVIESAEVTCGGILTVKDGIKGDGKQFIKTGSDIHSGYISNVNITCNGSIFVSNEIRNAIIICDDEVTVVKPTGLILGGKITATNKVSAAFIGNIYGVPTEIEVGISPKFREEYYNKKEEIISVQKDMDNLRQRITLIAHNSPESLKNKRLKKFNEEMKLLSRHFDKINTDLIKIEKDYFNVEAPTVYSIKKIYPGVLIKIKQLKYEVKEELSHVMFRISKDEIIYSKIE